jgi:hypothetical protein
MGTPNEVVQLSVFKCVQKGCDGDIERNANSQKGGGYFITITCNKCSRQYSGAPYDTISISKKSIEALHLTQNNPQKTR